MICLKKDVFTKPLMLLCLFCATPGCGDDDEPPKDTDDTDTGDAGDESTDSEPAELEHWRSHCPGELDEKNDKYYCIIPAGEITTKNVTQEEKLEWIPDFTYILDGTVFIGDGADETVLTIQPGATILGNPVTDLDNTAALIIQRFSKIKAEGTKDAPILFSSALADGKRASDDWGGLILNGNAPINTCTEQPCESIGEGNTGTYGGDDEDDDSGILAYVRIEFSGKRINSSVEYNGLALQGVGRGTDIHHIHIHRPGDDGIEFFGGTAEVHHLLITGTGDDLFDWTSGWRGKVQFAAFVHLEGLQGDMGIEADNNEGNYDATPRSGPTLYNFTMGGNVLLRRGTAGTIVNSAITGILDIADEASWTQVDNGSLSISYSVIEGKNSFVDDDIENLDNLESDQWSKWEGNRQTDDIGIDDMKNATEPNFIPSAGSVLLSGATTPPESDSFFEKVDFVGAMGEEDWTEGWCEFPLN